MTRAHRNHRIVLAISLLPLTVTLLWRPRPELIAATILPIAILCYNEHQQAQRQRSLATQRKRWAFLAAQEPPTPTLLQDFIRYAPGETPQITRHPTRLREVLDASLKGKENRTHQGGDPHVSADGDALRHALDQLIAKAETPIEIHLTTHGPLAELAVMHIDTKEDFRLAVASKIADAHGGHLRLEAHTAVLSLPLLT